MSSAARQPAGGSTAGLPERLRPLLADFRDLTGAEFRLVLHRDDARTVLHDSLPEDPAAGEPRRRVRELSECCSLELWQAAEAGAAADFLLDWVGQVFRLDEQHARLVEDSRKQERVVAELELARRLQSKLLPPLEGFADLAEVAGRCDPAYEIGGDFYQLTRLPGGRLGVMLGDVSSHGISAALIMALTMSAVAIFARELERPAAVLREIHRALLRELETTEMYMSVFFGVLDPASDRLEYANAGHPFAFRVSERGVDRLDALDPPLGIVAHDAYSQTSADWSASDDILVLFTDGLAGDAPGGREGTATWVGELSEPREPQAIVDALFEAGGMDARPDDRTALAIRLRAPDR